MAETESRTHIHLPGFIFYMRAVATLNFGLPTEHAGMSEGLLSWKLVANHVQYVSAALAPQIREILSILSYPGPLQVRSVTLLSNSQSGKI